MDQGLAVYLKSLGSRLCRAKMKRDRPPRLLAGVRLVVEDRRWRLLPCTAVEAVLFLRPNECNGALSFGRWCPMPYMAGGADQILRPVKYDGKLSKAVTSIESNLGRRKGPVLRVEYGRESVPLRSGCSDVNTLLPDDGGG
jgi:hypothetical protein